MAEPPRANTSGTSKVAAYTAVLLTGLSLWRTPIYDPDLGFHLLGGSWVYHVGDVPRADFINVLNPTWLDYHWFGQWLIYLAYRFLGFPGVQAICGIIGAALGVILLKIVLVSARKVPLPLAVLYIMALETLSYTLISTRPTSMAVVIVAAGLFSLIKYGEKALLPLFLLTAVCANIHIYWVLLPLLWGTRFCLSRFLPWRHPRGLQTTRLKAYGGSLALIFAGSLSPYGLFNSEPGFNAKLANYYVFLDVAINPAWIKKFITELQPGFNNWNTFSWFALAALCIVVRCYSLQRLRVKSYAVMLFCGSFLMLIEAAKYAIFFLICSAPLLTPILVRLSSKGMRHLSAARWCILKPQLLLYGCLLYGASIALVSFPFTNSNAEKTERELLQMLPINACFAIPSFFSEPVRIIRVAAPYDLGGWCAWALNQPRCPSMFRLTFDGRTQFVPIQRLLDGFNLFSLQGDWRGTLTRDDPDAVVVGYEHPLGQILDTLKEEWVLPYKDERFGVFVRKRQSDG